MGPRLSPSADTTFLLVGITLNCCWRNLKKTLMTWYLWKHLCQIMLLFLAHLFEGGIEHGILLQTFCSWLPHYCGGFLVTESSSPSSHIKFLNSLKNWFHCSCEILLSSGVSASL